MTDGIKLLGLFGHPVHHSLSPAMHNKEFMALNLPYYYQAFDVAPANLKEAVAGIRALGIRGVNVTIPHKVDVMQYLDDVDEHAELIGAVNTIVNENGYLTGFNTDSKGFMDSLKEETAADIEKSRILVIGAGGAARAVLTGLWSSGASDVCLTNRSMEKAQHLAGKFEGRLSLKVWSKEEAAAKNNEYDIIINTTSLGMSPNTKEKPWPTDRIKPECICCDLIYNPLKTEWLHEMEEKGNLTLNGLGMFVRQGAASFEKWTGSYPDVHRMKETVLQNLGGK
ncbi:shikimate dehydrogenase [Sinobaca qinghaiensis]|uniref:Shikimate dehydrogenase (NADP(+)) n=1 Tax=Sinobaca qinghaiensis TaxID=342944 RepID=A0A419V3I6_9BACL|nr:shikimate dehydrogenase [Sinobaca qinghaiensis]RKD73058.1 shikimate dehydrogenase [Sinobaca qinghaiensis]